MKCPICGGELNKTEEKSLVKGFEVPTEFYRCEYIELIPEEDRIVVIPK